LKSSKILLVAVVCGVLVGALVLPMLAQDDPAKTSKVLFEEAKKLYAVHKYDAALKRLEQVDRNALGWLERGAYDSLLEKTRKASVQKQSDETAFDEGKTALTKNQFGTAVERLTQAAGSSYLDGDKREMAEGLLAVAKEKHSAAVDQAKDLLKTAKAAVKAGKADEAKAALDQVKAMDVRLGSWESRDLAALEKDVAAMGGEATAVAAETPATPAEPPAEMPAEVATETPAETPTEVVAETPAAEPTPELTPQVVSETPEKAVATETPAETPAETPTEVKPETPVAETPTEVVETPAETSTEVVVETPAAEPALPLAEQARRAEAKDETKQGQMALADHEYEKAKIHFTRALALWPDYEQATAGRDEAMKFLAEREEPIGKYVQTARDIERQRINANVQELLNQAKKAVGADTPDACQEALQSLAEADRIIDRARVLTPEEAESLRDQSYALRGEIQKIQDQKKEERTAQATAEVNEREQTRRQRDEEERANKVAQLWDQIGKLRRSMQFAEAIAEIDTLLKIDPQNDRARVWREDLLYLEAQERQVSTRDARQTGTVEALVDVEEAATHPGEKIHGVTEYLRYPDAKTWKELTEVRRAFELEGKAEPKAVADTRARLSEEIDLDFEKTSLDNVLKFISDFKKGLNIVVDPDVVGKEGIDLSTRLVDLKVKQMSVESVLGLILGADLGYRVEAGYILVTTRDKLQQNLPVVTYPVHDLVASIPDFAGQAPRISIVDVTNAAASSSGGGGGGQFFGAGGTATQDQGAVGVDELKQIITRTVSYNSDPNVAAWSEEGGPAAIEYLNGLLIVSQTRRGHAKLADLLEQLRRERAIMISIESRFVTVTDDFLQDITLDVDVTILGSDRFAQSNNPIYSSGTQTINQPVLLPDGTQAMDTTVTPAVPIYADQTYSVPRTSSPVSIASTGSNGEGTSKLLDLAGTAFSNFDANEGGMAVSGTFLDDVQVGFLLRAIQADKRSTTLFAPRLTLYNGQRSYISVSYVRTYIADLEPVVAEAAVGWDPTTSSIPTGSTLDVKATVSADRRYVQMDLMPQVAGVATFRQVPIQAATPSSGIATAYLELPEVSIQELKTTVRVPDGGTLLLGGSKKYLDEDVETGVPVLSKVPILKRLFNNRAGVRHSENLLILIRPKIIIQAEAEKKLGYANF